MIESKEQEIGGDFDLDSFLAEQFPEGIPVNPEMGEIETLVNSLFIHFGGLVEDRKLADLANEEIQQVVKRTSEVVGKICKKFPKWGDLFKEYNESSKRSGREDLLLKLDLPRHLEGGIA